MENIRRATEQELITIKLNNLSAAKIDARADRAFFQEALYQTTDNDLALELEKRINDIDEADKMLEKKIVILERFYASAQGHDRPSKKIHQK